MDDSKKTSTFLDLNFGVILHNFLNAAKRLIWFVLIISLLLGGGIYIRTENAYTPQYTVSGVFAVNANYSSTTDITSHSDFMDASAALSLSQTFPYVIRSENTMMLLRQELGKTYINGTITATSTADVGLFTLTVVSDNPQDAYDILLAVIEIYPQAASSILGDTQIEIIKLPVEPPTAPTNTSGALRSALIWAGVSFLAGLILIFLFSMTRKTVHSAEDLRKLVNLKCLAYIPKVRLKKHSNTANLTITITNPRINPSFNESLRNLRIKLQKSLSKDESHILLVTSTLPNEGKTTVATNLALSLAAEGKKVLLIDGDLRKQSLKESMGLDEPSDGLVDLLQGNSKNFRLLNVPKSTLLLLSGDETSDQPHTLLDIPRMGQILELLREKLDFIIIDSPPAGILSDAATLAKYTDATLYVVRQDLASTNQILESIQTLSNNGVNIIGCVLNQIQAGTTRYGYGSKYNNTYGYSYGYKYANNHYGYGGYRNRYAKAEEAATLLTDEITKTEPSQEAVQTNTPETD